MSSINEKDVTYYIVDDLGNSDLFGSTFKQASDEASARNSDVGEFHWSVVPDFLFSDINPDTVDINNIQKGEK